MKIFFGFVVVFALACFGGCIYFTAIDKAGYAVVWGVLTLWNLGNAKLLFDAIES